MPKFKSKFYAVKVGREGPKIYTSWEEVSGDFCEQMTTDIYPSAPIMSVVDNN